MWVLTLSLCSSQHVQRKTWRAFHLFIVFFMNMELFLSMDMQQGLKAQFINPDLPQSCTGPRPELQLCSSSITVGWRICPYQSSEISAFIFTCSLRICLFWSSRLTGVQSSEKEQIPSYWFQFFLATGPVTLISDEVLSWIMDVDILSSGWTLGLAGRNLSKSEDFFCLPNHGFV